MKTLQKILMFYRLTWEAAWCEEGTQQEEDYKTLRDAAAVLVTTRIAISRFWVVWLLFFWFIGPFASVYYIVRLCIKDLKKELF